MSNSKFDPELMGWEVAQKLGGWIIASKVRQNSYCVIAHFESWRDTIRTQNMFVHTYQIGGSKRKYCKFQKRVQIFL